MTLPTKERNRPSKLLLLLLAALGVLGNLLNVPLFFGVDFIFGSIAVLIAVSIFGPVWGALVAVLPILQTYSLWNHLYASVGFMLEAIVVGLLLRRFRTNLALAGLWYWLLIGLPLVFLVYRLGLRIETLDSLLVALKQAANGVVNAICASLAVTYIPWLRRYQADRAPRITLFDTIFNFFLAAALIPALIILSIDARRALRDVERDARSEVVTISTGISLSVARWRGEHMRSIQMLADAIESMGTGQRSRMQKLLEHLQENWPDFRTVFVANEQGVTIAFDPLVNARGESTLGISFADREYFQVMKSGEADSHVSPVFMARGGVFEPIVNLTRPLRFDGKFAGIVVGTLDLVDLTQILKGIRTRTEYVATLVDGGGNVIATTRSDLKPLDPYRDGADPDPREKETGIYHRWLSKSGTAGISKWAASYLGRSVPVSGAGDWKLVVEVPLRSQQTPLYRRYVKILGLVLILAFALLLASYTVASSIARPLAQLSAETTDLPNRIELHKSMRWPSSRLLEVNVLVRNFQHAVAALKQRFEELEASRAQLDQANRIKDEFLSIASHELKTPLTPLKMQMQLLKKLLGRGGLQELTPERLEKVLYTSERQITRLTHLIDDLLDVARINSGRLKLNLERMDLAALVRELVERYSPQLNEAGCEVSLHVPDRLQVSVDPLRIEQVLANLLTNAAKYAPGQPVVVSLREENGYALITVQDHGPGIPEEARERVFERFERVVSSSTVGGLGLGLFISRQIVEAHSGEISVETEAGQGSTFSVRLRLG